MQKYQDVVLNQNGNPVSGVQVTVTDLLGTPVSVYSANTIGLNVNPLTSDNNGRFSFYAPDGRYNLSFSFGGNVVASITDILLEDPMDGSDAVFNDVTILGELSDASKVTSAPVGGLTATNVQAALAELDSEKIDASSLAAPGGSALVGFKQSGTGALDRTVEGKLSEFVSVKDFGAVCDGATDDTAAYNKLFQVLRDAINTGVIVETTASVNIELSPGVSVVNGSINATGLTGINININGNGVVIVGKCSGKPVIDFLGSCNYKLRNTTVIGDATLTPSYGIQRGRASNANAGKVGFDNVVVDGYFTRAAYYNLAGEVDVYLKCRFTNRRADPATYTMIEDGGNYENITSEFIAQTNPVGVEISFNEQLHLSSEFRHFGNGVPILILGNQERHNYVNCYARTDGGSHIVETRYGNRIRDLWMDMHAEASTVGRYLVVDNVNPTGAVTFSGLKIVDHQPFVTDCLIDFTGATQNVLFDCLELDIGEPQNTVPIFGDGAGVGVIKALCEGTIKWASSKTLNLANCAFNGLIFTKDTNSITHTVGAYSIIRRAATGARYIETKGYGRFVGAGESASPANYVEVRGSAAGAGVNIVAGGTDTNVGMSITAKGTGAIALQANSGVGVIVAPPATPPVNYMQVAPSVAGSPLVVSAQGTDADIDMQIQAKGAGRVRFGTRTASADAPITGYIEIKDAGGTLRRLAVIG